MANDANRFSCTSHHLASSRSPPCGTMTLEITWLLPLSKPMTTKPSYAAGPTQPVVRELTLGDLLKEAADDAPERLALIAGACDPNARRQWTYTELHCCPVN